MHGAGNAPLRDRDRVGGPVERVDHVFRVPRERLPGRGEDDAAPGPLDEIAAGFALELGELLADRGRADAHRGRGRRDRAPHRDRVQHAEAPSVEVHEATLHKQ